jgi:hypothetical protein
MPNTLLGALSSFNSCTQGECHTHRYCRCKRLRLTEIVCAALIPFLSASGEKIPCGALLTGGLGIVIAISAAASALYSFHENWIQFRSSAEQLEHEKFLYLTNTEPFLVQRVEGILSKENSSWAQATNSQQQEVPKI